MAATTTTSSSSTQASNVEALLESCGTEKVAIDEKEWKRVFGEQKPATAAATPTPGTPEAKVPLVLKPDKTVYFISRWSPVVVPPSVLYPRDQRIIFSSSIADSEKSARDRKELSLIRKLKQPLDGFIQLIGIQFEFKLVYSELKEAKLTSKASDADRDLYIQNWERNSQPWGTQAGSTAREEYGTCEFTWVSPANELVSIQNKTTPSPWIVGAVKQARFVYTLGSSRDNINNTAEYYTDWFETKGVATAPSPEESILTTLFRRTAAKESSADETLEVAMTTLTKSAFGKLSPSILVQQRLTKPGTPPIALSHRIGKTAKQSISTNRVVDMQTRSDNLWRQNRYAGIVVMKFPYEKEKLPNPRSQLF